MIIYCKMQEQYFTISWAVFSMLGYNVPKCIIDYSKFRFMDMYKKWKVIKYSFCFCSQNEVVNR